MSHPPTPLIPNRRRRRSRFGAPLASVAIVAALVAGVAPADAATDLVPGAKYEGEGASLRIGGDGATVEVTQLPVDLRCTGVTPTNAGEMGGFPIDVAADGTFRSGGAAAPREITGRFSADGKKVTGTIREAAFVDPAKDMDCKAYSGKWSAKLVKGSVVPAGKKIARDDFSDPTSGFDVYNGANGYAEYLSDGRLRLGLRSAGTAASLRATPLLADADVQVDTVVYSADPNDAAGVVCRATDATSFLAGFLQADGTAFAVQLQNGAVVQRSSVVTVPPDVYRGPRERTTLRLVCSSDPEGGRYGRLSFRVNGSEVVTLTTDPPVEGATGVVASGTAGATDISFLDFSVRTPPR